MMERYLELEEHYEMDYGDRVRHTWIYWYSDGEFEMVKSWVKK